MHFFNLKKNIILNINNYINIYIYFTKKYLYTINHKRIALNYLYFSMWTACSGTFLATLIRLELSYPGSHFFKGDSIKYLQVITSHALIMIFFVVIPIVFGFFANFFIPYHIGSKDVAFPRLNSIGFWIQPSGFFLLSKTYFLRPQIYKSVDSVSSIDNKLYNNISYKNLTNILYNNITNSYSKINKESTYFKSNKNLLSSKELLLNSNLNYSNNWHFYSSINDNLIGKTTFFVKCSNATQTMSGWTFITPFSSKLEYTSLGAQDIAILGVIFSGISTTISFTNLLITRRTLSLPGMRYRKAIIPFLSISLFLVMRMLSLITPVLGAAMIMLFLDRHYKTAFFDYSYGGDAILFHHLFWFFGHPEVYVVLIPAFGIINMLIPFYSHRRIASKNHLMWATYIMAYMGFLVWGHHMYLIGLDHRSRSLYSTITVMISLPAVVKIVNWTLTFLNSSIKYDIPFLFVLSFFLFFLCGGLTGMWLSHVGLNVYVHDTFYVVAHFHFMFSSSTFSAIFAGLYYYYFVIFGKKYSRIFAYFHLFYWFCGQWLTFIPLFWVGYNGLPRRYHDYPLMFSSWHGLSSSGHILNVISLFFFFLVIFDSSFFKQEEVINNYYIPRFYKRIQYYNYKIYYKKYLLLCLMFTS